MKHFDFRYLRLIPILIFVGLRMSVREVLVHTRPCDWSIDLQSQRFQFLAEVGLGGKDRRYGDLSLKIGSSTKDDRKVI